MATTFTIIAPKPSIHGGWNQVVKFLYPNRLLVHNEDHANNHIMTYCSQVYNQAAVNSWADPGVFTELSDSPQQLKLQMKKHLPKSFSKQQQQLVDFNKDLPYGYIMMQCKKTLEQRQNHCGVWIYMHWKAPQTCSACNSRVVNLHLAFTFWKSVNTNHLGRYSPILRDNSFGWQPCVFEP